MTNPYPPSRTLLPVAAILVALTGTVEPAGAQKEPPAAATEAVLELVIAGFDARRPGRLVCRVWQSTRDFLSPRALRQMPPTREGDRLVCRFRLPAAGRYAAGVLHDENGNGRLDTNFIGAPTEGWGTTRNVTHALSAPEFEESSLRIAGAVSTRVRLHY